MLQRYLRVTVIATGVGQDAEHDQLFEGMRAQRDFGTDREQVASTDMTLLRS